ncbi:hypothetical protein [Parvularcula sp. LCG005]|uniref:hypothetical protein n=1 Tax=Parvularcula sp. LCG005 TaxID=3078805 RepID=UPI002942D500|nr:hypothetical protein [Parvularcula sp. LCG005]WOI54738.1 hypothetical protein RUI03_06965 [Parvularcula sp. LCG005]
MDRFIHVRSANFTVAPPEDEHVVNEMYGQAFAEYVQNILRQNNVLSDDVYPEDWGWWVDAEMGNYSGGVLCHRSIQPDSGEVTFTCTLSRETDSYWSWKKWRKIDISSETASLLDILEKAFKADKDISFVCRTDDMLD